MNRHGLPPVPVLFFLEIDHERPDQDRRHEDDREDVEEHLDVVRNPHVPAVLFHHGVHRGGDERVEDGIREHQDEDTDEHYNPRLCQRPVRSLQHRDAPPKAGGYSFSISRFTHGSPQLLIIVSESLYAYMLWRDK